VGAKIKARAADGCEISSVIVKSLRDKPLKVLSIHALAMSGRQWLGLAAALGDVAELAAIDCRGHGDSERRRGYYTLDLMADDCIAVLDALGWRDALIVGCSMGGCVAQALAARHPSRVSALLLADTTADYGRDAEEKWHERGARALAESMQVHVDFQLKRWFTDDFIDRHPDIVAGCLEVFLANDTGCYADTCRMLGAMDLRPQLPLIRCPTSVIVGEEDYATPLEMACSLAAAIPNAGLAVIPNAKHFAPIERPSEVASEILKLAARA
jgi:3-oxoadipate enol-lactonase